jgi:hypothetical protein
MVRDVLRGIASELRTANRGFGGIFGRPLVEVLAMVAAGDSLG